MRIAAIDRLDIRQDFEGLPVEIRQSGDKLQAIVLLILSVIAIAVLLVPPLVMAFDYVTNTAGPSAIAGNPVSATLLCLGSLVGLALWTVPFRAGLSRLGSRRTAMIVDQHVSVEDQTLTGRRRWSLPISQFAGVTHHNRATISGARHEIILVHPDDRQRDILLSLTERPPNRGVAHFAQLLGVTEINAKQLYINRRSEAFAPQETAIPGAA